MAIVATEQQGGDRIAQWDRCVRLSRVDGTDGSQRYVVEALDDANTAEESVSYSHDDFPHAVNDFDLQVLEALDESVAVAVKIGLRTVNAVALSDLDALATLIHDDFVYVDHRPIGYPDLDRSELLDVETAEAEAGTTVWLSDELHAGSSTGWVTTGSFWTPAFGLRELGHGIFVNIIDNSQIARTEVYPYGQLDAALARFAELA